VATALEVAAQLRAAPGVIQKEMQSAIRKGGQILEASVRVKLPASGRMRGVGASGAAVGVRSTTVGLRRPTALIRATGPVHLLERDTRTHTISPRRAKALLTPDGPRASVRHPGTRGQHPFEKGIAEGLLLAKAVVEGAFSVFPRKI
jgi:hypothetical protein